VEIKVETGQVLAQVGAVHDERAFRQQEEMIAPLRGPQGSRHAEPERPRSGRQHSIARISQGRVAARGRILLGPPDRRHADPRERGPAALPHRGSARNRWHVTAGPANGPGPRALNPEVGRLARVRTARDVSRDRSRLRWGGGARGRSSDLLITIRQEGDR